MRGLGILSFGQADKLEVLDVPKPEISGPHDIIVNIKAIALNPGDAVRVFGYSRLLETARFPLIIGIDFAGTVAAVGPAITSFTAGDNVYGMTTSGGAAAEYLLLTPPSSGNKYTLAKMPPSLSFVQACTLPAGGHTAMESLARAESELPGGLRGKTVLIPAGLSGVGCIAVQVAKNVYGAGRVITTVSTGKVAKVDALLGSGVVDQVVDYTTQDVVYEIGKAKIDFMLDTVFTAMASLQVMKPETGVLFTITGKSGITLAKDFDNVPWLLLRILDLVDWMFRMRALRWRVRYDHVYVALVASDLDKLTTWVEDGKLRPVVGRVEKVLNVEAVRNMLAIQMAAKGSLGRLVVDFE